MGKKERLGILLGLVEFQGEPFPPPTQKKEKKTGVPLGLGTWIFPGQGLALLILTRADQRQDQAPRPKLHDSWRECAGRQKRVQRLRAECGNTFNKSGSQIHPATKLFNQLLDPTNQKTQTHPPTKLHSFGRKRFHRPYGEVRVQRRTEVVVKNRSKCLGTSPFQWVGPFKQAACLYPNVAQTSPKRSS